MKEIERAIELITAHLKITEQFLENSNPKTTNADVLKNIEDDKKDVVSYNLAIQILQSELDRQENKALTLSELKEMVGEPVWIKNKCYILIHYHDEDFIFLTQKGVYISNEVAFSSYMYEKSWIAFRYKEEHK